MERERDGVLSERGAKSAQRADFATSERPGGGDDVGWGNSKEANGGGSKEANGGG